jgi:hypothetical protein
MESPIEGPPRKPARIRVADDQLAADIRKAMPEMDVHVAPTPELDETIMNMREDLTHEKPADMSYCEGGRISQDTMEFLFRAAGLLFKTAPWKYIYETDLFRVDIPELEMERACLSVIGAGEETAGVLIFPSREGFRNFRSLAEEGIQPAGPVDLETGLLSLSYERGADLPGSMRKEAARHRWPVAGPAAYPRVINLESDGMHGPLTENDIRIATHCALSLTSFFAKHGDFSEIEVIEPICECYFEENDLEVKLTFPYP